MTDWRLSILKMSPWIEDNENGPYCYWCDHAEEKGHADNCIYVIANKPDEPHCECCHFGDSLD